MQWETDNLCLDVRRLCERVDQLDHTIKMDRMERRFDRVEDKLDRCFSDMRRLFDEQKRDLTWRMFMMMGVMTTVIIAAIKL